MPTELADAAIYGSLIT